MPDFRNSIYCLFVETIQTCRDMQNKMEINFEGKIFHLAWSFIALNDLGQSTLISWLNEEEQNTANGFGNDAKAVEFAAGRYCVKQAFATHTPSAAAESVTINVGVWGFPIIEGQNVNISIAHTHSHAMAICADGALPAGVDIEDHSSSNDEAILSQLSRSELRLLSLFPDESEGLHLLWAAKEAVAKAMRTGFRLPMSFFEISSAAYVNGTWHVNFKTASVLSVTAIKKKSVIVALALPAGSVVQQGFEALFSAALPGA